MRTPLPGLPLRPALVAAAVVLVASAAHARSYSAPRYDVHLAIQRDGSLSVREEVEFRFEGGPFRRVSREVPTRRTDGIVDLVATLDGAPLEVGTGERQVEIDARPDRTRIVWHLPTTSDATVRLGLRYRALGVAERVDDSHRVAWTVLPGRHDYRIHASRTTITWPEGTKPFDTEEARAGLWRATGESRGKAVATERTRDAWIIDVTDVRKDGSYVASLRFPLGSLTVRPARWQQRQAERDAAARGLAASAGLIALLGGAFVLFLWARSPRGTHDHTPHASTNAINPDARPVAIASALRRRSPGGRREDIVPALLDLARRGALRFETGDAGRWSKPRFRLVRSRGDVNVAPHERILLDAVFGSDGETREVELSKVSKRTARNWKAYRAAVNREMLSEGLLDSDRLAARRRMQVFGACALGAGLVALLACAVVFSRRFGAPAVFPALGVLVVAVTAFIAARRISPLSDRGEREGARWRAFAAGLRDVARGGGTLAGPEYVEAWLPFAAAAGSGAGLATRAHREGRPLPAWFHSGTADHGRTGALAAMLSSDGAAGSHGGSGAGGAAGGGSSGAN